MSKTSEETFPRSLRGSCSDCQTEVYLHHPNGIGGEGQGWPCLVCGNPVRLDGSDYTA